MAQALDGAGPTSDTMDYLSLFSKPSIEVDFTILDISCSPFDVLIKFQGRRVSHEFDYHILQTELQHVSKVYEDLDVGQLCLVQDKPLGAWHRGKILDKINQIYEVVLIDQGNVVKVASRQISSASDNIFSFPPKVVNGIFSNLLPVDEKWSPRAIKYFSCLKGQHHSGLVKATLPHQLILLEVPKIINYAVELNLAKYMDIDSFCLLVEITHNSLGKQMPDLLQPKYPSSQMSQGLSNHDPRFQKVKDHLRPAISVGTIEKIKLSAALSLDHFYCHIVTWEVQLQNLTSSMCSYYESSKAQASLTLGSHGILCAAKRKDEKWYRGVIQAIVSSSDLKVWFIDIGSSETIRSTHVYKLQPEFLTLPMMAIPCALSVNDLVESSQRMQLMLFKEALMGHIVIAQLDQFCMEERVFSVTLHEKDTELNPSCHLSNLKVPSFSPSSYTDIVTPQCVQDRDKTKQVMAPPQSPKSQCVEDWEETKQVIASPQSPTSQFMQDREEAKQEITPPSQSPTLKMVNGEEIISLKSLQMDLDSVHIVYVEYAMNPSNFWVRTDEFFSESCAMMADLAEAYNKCDAKDMLLKDPHLGELCCARYTKDGHYYRAVVTEVLKEEISVYFIDFGNTETIPFYDVQTLLPQFSTLPALAMGCTLAYAYPTEDVWTKSSNVFFNKIVAGKALVCHVLAKQQYKYVVEMRFSDSSENSDIVSILVQAGYAELWKTDLNPRLSDTEHQLPDSETKYKRKNKSHLSIGKHCSKGDVQISLRDWTTKTKRKKLICEPPPSLSSSVSPISYKQYTFKPGAVLHVKCSHVESPGDFWCQLSCNIHSLDAFMDEIQAFYKSCNNQYRHGQLACIAKSTFTGKYYRAIIQKFHTRYEVEVIFVDFGRGEKVLVSNLREIQPQFLKWEGQAFRCCLSKGFPSCCQHNWSARACKNFKSLLNNSDNLFKCTIISLFTIGYDDLFNAVDLEISYNAILNENPALASERPFNAFNSSVPAIHLRTFCYSSFGLSVGSKANVYITYIYNTGKFYCQLEKNENRFEILNQKISDIVEKMKPQIETKTAKLCLAKYPQDGNFYRALACPVDSSFSLAFFVDYGDSLMVKQTELLQIPLEAVDVFLEPMQALPFYLSDLKEVTFSKEAKTWFEEQYGNRLLSATVMSIDDDGQLEVELYSGNISINCEIKKILGVDLLQKKAESIANAGCNSFQPPAGENSSARGKVTSKTNSVGNILPMSDGNEISENTLLLSQNSMFRQTQKKTLDDVQAVELTKATDCQNFCSPQRPKKLFKASEVTQLILETGSTHPVFASYVSSPCKFYVQLAKYEKQIMQLEEELGDMSFQAIDVKHLEQGVLVVAQYPDDKAFYRAEIKEVLKGCSFQVEFIDYGNTAIVDSSSIFTFPEAFLNVPRLSISVFLKGFQRQEDCDWNAEAVNKFCEKLINESFDCMFLCRHEDRWEVCITSEGQPEFNPRPSNFDINVPVSKSDTLLKPGQIESVKHVHLSDSGTLYVTLACPSQDSQISEHISLAVKQITNRLMVKDISEGMLCLAKSKKMQAWLRASVEKIFPETLLMSVFFVDHGASEVISMYNARKLSFMALSIPYQAIACKWIWSEKFKKDLNQAQFQSILKKATKVQFLELLDSPGYWKVEMLAGNLMLKDLLSAEIYRAEPQISISKCCFNFDSKVVSIQRKLLKPLEVFSGYVISFQDPFSFAIQMENSIEFMNKLSLMIQKLPDEFSHLPRDAVTLGSACLIKSFEDQEWCRAEIISINYSHILVNLFDYGVYKSIPYSARHKLKVMPQELACLPPLTYCCKLYGVVPKNGLGWSDDGVKYCLDFVKSQDLLIMPIKKNAGITEVCIYGAGNLAEKLVCKGFACKSEIEHGATELAVESEEKIHFSEIWRRLKDLRCE